MERNEMDDGAEVVGVRPRSVYAAMNSQPGKEDQIRMERTLAEGRFEPVEPGRCDPISQKLIGTPTNGERRRTGTSLTPEGDIEKTFNVVAGTRKRPLQRSCPVRSLKQRYVLSCKFAAFVAAEFRLGDV
jgi:hypothetical protein